MRVVIGEAVVRISHWYIACYRRSDSEDGTKRSELEETTMGDGGGSILFFSTPFISRNSPLSEHLDHTNSWSKVRRESPAYLIFCFNLFPVFLTPSFLISLTVKTKNPIIKSELYETTSDDNQRNLYIIQ